MSNEFRKIKGAVAKPRLGIVMRGGCRRAVSREVRRYHRLTAGAVIEGKYQQTLRATWNWKRGESGGEKAGTAVSLRLASLCAVKSVALPIGYTSDSACPKTHFMPVVSHFHKDIGWECERSVRLPTRLRRREIF